ncbi:MAG: dienelactone hydrolase family protein [Paludibacteraceae bacterium]
MFLVLLTPPASAQPNYEHRNGYTAHLVRVPVSHADTATGYLLIPDSALQAPAVLLLHDHGAHFTIGKEKMVCPICPAEADSACEATLQDARRWVNKFYDGMFVGDSLAQAGYVVLAIDAVYWGERRQAPSPSDSEAVLLQHAQTAPTDGVPAKSPPPTPSPQAGRGSSPESPILLSALGQRSGRIVQRSDRNALNLKSYQPAYYQHHLFQYGEAWFETILRDDRACVDYLRRLPCVDSARIAAFGFSMGAFRAWQLAASDTRIKVCIAANWMTTRADHLGSTLLPSDTNPSAYSMYRPNCPDDYPETAARIAPRPFLLLYGEHDPLFTPDSVQTAIRTISTRYRDSLPAEHGLFRAFPMPYRHFFSKEHWENTLDFFAKHL